MKKTIQIEKALKAATRKYWPTYRPPTGSIKSLFFAAIDLQQKRGRRFALHVPLIFWTDLEDQERSDIIQRLNEIRSANGARMKRARLKRRRFYKRKKRNRYGMVNI